LPERDASLEKYQVVIGQNSPQNIKLDNSKHSSINQAELNAQIVRSCELEQTQGLNQSIQQAQKFEPVQRATYEEYNAMTQHAEEERGEQSDMGAVHDPLATDANKRTSDLNQDSAQVDNQITHMQAFDLADDVEYIYSRTANQMKWPISKTAAAGFSRNNFTQEQAMSPTQIDRMQTMETPFKMKDAIKNEKFVRISSLKLKDKSNFSENPKGCRKLLYNNKIIGNSFLGSSNMNDRESRKPNNQIGPKDFIAHQLLGSGSFGEVFLVEEIATKELYAMKVLSKEKIQEQQLLKYAFAEKDIMAEMTKIEQPYIVKIKYTF
jgi:hypothetical protein